VPAGSRVKINFENQDTPLVHNFALFKDSSATESIFVGEPVSGRSGTYEFTAPAQPGTYYFRCNFHAFSMFGDFVVR
jgi:plastocyanin